jgi:SsrA-binding protein
MAGDQLIVKNKKAQFNYEWVDTLVAGLVLTGTEIKSIRQGKVNLNDAYCQFQHGELFIINMHISEYEQGSYYNHAPRRSRKLLLQKREINKWHGKIKEKGLTIIATKLFLNEKGKAKLEIALAKGKKTHDKRETIKARDSQRELQRVMKR